MTIPEIKVLGAQGNSPTSQFIINNQGFSKLTCTVTASQATISVARIYDENQNMINFSTNGTPHDYDISGLGQTLTFAIGSSNIRQNNGYVIATDIVFS